MEAFKSVDDILNFAIEKEEEAAKFYIELAEKMAAGGMRQIFEEFSQEEMRHKEKLLGVKSGKKLTLAEKKITDLKIGDYLVDVEPGPDLSYQDALIIAMKKEKASYKLYSHLAAMADDPDVSTLMSALAQEEAKHKLRFEIEYDDKVLTEN
ncbi:ferritin family protein [candidate division CSSED10-310 bacterium]|uniref:Ferritin family protein n=1 Tax=candidate division CSSED10-310 bacterium TaxID=2855610 RepID=A0ABV6Z0P4_UNCC1